MAFGKRRFFRRSGGRRNKVPLRWTARTIDAGVAASDFASGVPNFAPSDGPHFSITLATAADLAQNGNALEPDGSTIVRLIGNCHVTLAGVSAPDATYFTVQWGIYKSVSDQGGNIGLELDPGAQADLIEGRWLQTGFDQYHEQVTDPLALSSSNPTVNASFPVPAIRWDTKVRCRLQQFESLVLSVTLGTNWEVTTTDDTQATLQGATRTLIRGAF